MGNGIARAALLAGLLMAAHPLNRSPLARNSVSGSEG